MFCEYAKQASRGRENSVATATELFVTKRVLAVLSFSTRLVLLKKAKLARGKPQRKNTTPPAPHRWGNSFIPTPRLTGIVEHAILSLTKQIGKEPSNLKPSSLCFITSILR
ncbi:MAG: hypothetical protein COV91_06055 [Candidatus Taylorbacteria bacterium CG11_big_fil_rev_8_21_14_0_20_46_11]|uniref:Uncharacterized protein n=1 Tax=Candidatus Taylorbacteria bacterium CG11_big_fil_rev_8_21_14_0_20_46_11 TaxID=1975025 RepID=A0A2H0K9Y0_9BACT|nr:MAG: hypothetical protein COV91_06055 [Candidatus Taylorbacteria bacterium CG11_big_fil_rev_8_21_14_0_20_46_11]